MGKDCAGHSRAMDSPCENFTFLVSSEVSFGLTLPIGSTKGKQIANESEGVPKDRHRIGLCGTQQGNRGIALGQSNFNVTP